MRLLEVVAASLSPTATTSFIKEVSNLLPWPDVVPK